jgi:hypothetical protein
MSSICTAILAIPYLHLIVIAILLALVVISVVGNIGINWKEKKFTFGQPKPPKVRSCSDCIKLLMAKRTAFEVLYNTKQTSILRQQMVFAEHKLMEIEILTKKEIHPSVKDEIRRSYKENGFVDMNPADYDRYVSERIDTLTSMLNTADIKVPPIIKDIYNNAKNTKIRIDTEIKKLEDDFIKEIDQLIGEKDV